MCTTTKLDMVLKDFVAGTVGYIRRQAETSNAVRFIRAWRFDYESDVDIAVLADISKEEEHNYTDDIVTLVSKLDKKHSYAVLLPPIVLSYAFFIEWQETIPLLCRYYLILSKDLGYCDVSESGAILNEVSKLLEAYFLSILPPVRLLPPAFCLFALFFGCG